MDELNEKEIAKKNYMKIWNTGEENLLYEYAANNLEVSYTHFGQMYRGMPEYKKMLQLTHDFFPDMHLKITNIITSADYATITWL